MPWVYLKCRCGERTAEWQEDLHEIECVCGGTMRWHRVVYGQRPMGRDAQPFDPVTLFRDPTAPEGQYRVPGWNDEKPPAGYEKVEIKTIREWEAVTRQMSVHGRRVAEEAYHEKQQAIDKVRAEQRAELRNEMRHWHGEARAFAEAALARSEARKPRPMPTGEVISHALEYDSSNREPWRDERTGWRGRKS